MTSWAELIAAHLADAETELDAARQRVQRAVYERAPPSVRNAAIMELNSARHRHERLTEAQRVVRWLMQELSLPKSPACTRPRRCLANGVEYRSMHAAAQALGLTRAKLWRRLRKGGDGWGWL